MTVQKVGVVGAGLMGAGIAEVCARHDLETTVCDLDAAATGRGKARIEASLARGLAAGKLTDDEHGRAMTLLRFTSDIASIAECDVVIEAVVEQLLEKAKVFEQLDATLPEHALLASNTSSLPIIEMARVTKRPHRVVGLHFFNPAPVMPLLEVVRSIATSDETMTEARAFGEQVGKHVIIAPDRGGFIVNKLLIPFLSQAVRMYESGFASRDDIDEGMRLGCGHPMGPLQLLDYIGLDTALFVCEALYAEYAKPEYAPPPLLRRMVSAGQLGKKSGRGFYEYKD